MASKLKLTELLHPDSAVAAITINADNSVTIPTQSTTNLAYTGTLTGGTGVVNIGSGQIYKDAAGLVGIGTSGPTSVSGYTALNIKSTSGGELQLGNTAGTAQATFWSDANGITYTNYAATSQIWVTAASEKMRIDSSGNVGIGTSSPSRKLDVQGAPSGVGGNGTGVLANFVNNSTAYNASPTSAISLWNRYNTAGGTFPSAVLQAGKENTTDGNFAGYMSLQTTSSAGDSTERMRIDSSGRLLVGTTGLSGGGATQFSSSDKVTINSISGSYGQLQIGNPTAAAEASIAFIPGVSSYGSPPSSGNADNVWVVGAAIGSAGSLGIFNQGLNGIVCFITRSSTSWTFTSDERLKNINGGIENALDKVAQLRAVYYNWKSEPEGKQKVGLLAQDVLKVLPEAVTIPEQETDKNGNPTYLGLGMSDVVPLLTAAIQEQQALIQDLTTRLTTLEGN